MKSKHNRNDAITLISLVITIVVIIILSSIAIYLSLGNNGIFNRAKQAKEVTNKQEATDIINLKITNCQINKYAEKQEMPTLKELSISLRDDSEIAYVTEKSQVASTKYEVGENPSSIFTKLSKYPYEFEINSKLQLASIDGIKIIANVTPSNTPANSQNTMSGEEHFTGEYYFNGKPLYEKTIYISSLANSSTTLCYNHNIKNVDMIWIDTSKTYMIFSDGTTTTLYYAAGSWGTEVVAYCSNKDNFKIWTGTDRSNCSAYVTLKYTKTTDEGNGKTIAPTPAN